MGKLLRAQNTFAQWRKLKLLLQKLLWCPYLKNQAHHSNLWSVHSFSFSFSFSLMFHWVKTNSPIYDYLYTSAFVCTINKHSPNKLILFCTFGFGSSFLSILIMQLSMTFKLGTTYMVGHILIPNVLLIIFSSFRSCI